MFKRFDYFVVFTAIASVVITSAIIGRVFSMGENSDLALKILSIALAFILLCGICYGCGKYINNKNQVLADGIGNQLSISDIKKAMKELLDEEDLVYSRN